METTQSTTGRTRLVLFFLLRILLVTWIPLILLIVVFFASSLRAQRDRIIDGNIKLFESSINNYDFVFDSFFISAGDLLYAPEAHRIAPDSTPLGNREAILILQQEMRRISSRFDMINRVGLYLANARLFLGEDGFQTQMLYSERNPQAARVVANLPSFRNQWVPQHRVDAGFRTAEVVEYVMPLPSGQERPNAAYVYTFQVESLLNLFAVGQTDGFFVVSDSPGSVLFGNRDIDFMNQLIRDLDVARVLRNQSAQTSFVSTETRFIMHKSSPVSNLSYVLVMPENPLNEELSLSPGIILLAAITMGLSLVLTVLFSNYIAMPVAEVVSAVDLQIAGDRNRDGSKWSVIFHRLHRGHLADDVSVGRLVADHRSVAESAVAGVLLRTAPLSDDVRSIFTETGLTGPLYCVLLVDLRSNRPGRSAELSQMITERLRVGGGVFAVVLNPRQIAVVLSGASASLNRKSVFVYAERLHELASDGTETHSVGVGGVVSTIERLHESFHTAERGAAAGEKAGVIDGAAAGRERLAYPYARVRQLVQAIRDANTPLAIERLQTIAAEIREQSANVDAASLKDTYRMLYHDIEREAFELSASIGSAHNDQLTRLLSAPRLDHHAALEAIESQVRDLAGSLATHSDHDPGASVARVTQFIRENFRRDISLDELAQIAGVTNQYLSTLFKRRTGTTVVSYITAMRLEAARELLRETKKSVQTVAAEVGYANAQYFTRVFKRNAGVSPLQYRKAQSSIAASE